MHRDLPTRVEHYHGDWSTLATTNTARMHLSDPDDARWAGILNLDPFDTLDVPALVRHDFYVLQGGVMERGQLRARGSFFSRNQRLSLTAGADGSQLFCYRDAVACSSGHETWASEELDWREGSVEGMRVAPLSKLHHRVSLVAWQAGTRAAMHTHPHGEEIFVLSGALHDERGTYPTGSWMRFHPGSGHAPFALEPTLVLLRNGHLGAI